MTEVVDRVVEPATCRPGPDFEAFFTAYDARLRRYARRWLPASDAEDVAQETLSRALVRWNEFDSDRDPWPWLSVVARNLAFDLLRARRSREVGDGAQPADVQEWDSVPEQEALSQERNCLLNLALSLLPARQQQIVRLRAVQGMSIGEIAELFGTTPNATRQQLFRARRSLEAAFRAAGGSLPAVTPFGFVVAGASWVRRHVRELGPGALPAASLGAAAAAVIVATVVLPPFLQDDQPAPGARTTAVTSTLDAAVSPPADSPAAPAAPVAIAPPGLPPADGVTRAPVPAPPSPAGAASAPLPVSASMSSDLTPKPLAPGPQASANVTVTHPLGTTEVRTEGETEAAGPVCRLGLVDCN